jgi:phospholipid/cholesterol/gamma-HCH transport system substrate-binding protein
MATTPTNPWKLGLFVVAGVALAIGTLVYVGASGLRRQHVSYETYVDESVQGLDDGAPVFFRGVRVGQVADIGVAPDGRHVSLSLALYTSSLRNLGLAHEGVLEQQPGLRARLISLGITGLKAVELDFFDPATHPAPVLGFPVPERYIPATSSTLKDLADSMMQATQAMLRVADRTDKILGQLEDAHLPDAVAESARELDLTLATVRKTLASVDVGGLSAQARQLLADLAAAVRRADSMIAKLDGDDGLLATATRTTRALGDAASDAPVVRDEIVETMRDVQEAARSFQRLTDEVEREPDILIKGRRE